MAVTLEEITGENREAVLAVRVAPRQERFVSSVRDSLAEAAECQHAKPWYWAARYGSILLIVIGGAARARRIKTASDASPT